jgi:hypothetical protein
MNLSDSDSSSVAFLAHAKRAIKLCRKVNPAFQKALSCGAINRTYGKSQMEKHSKRMLVAILLLIFGTLAVINAYVQNIPVDYLIGLALALLGSIFWICAE